MRATLLVAVALCACNRDARSPTPPIGSGSGSGAAPAAVTPPAIPKPIAFDPAAIDAWVGAQLAERGAIGASLVIVRDGKTQLAKGYGTKRGPLTRDAPNLRSLSRPTSRND